MRPVARQGWDAHRSPFCSIGALDFLFPFAYSLIALLLGGVDHIVDGCFDVGI
jgi:hypothetical protein